ncbi:MAG: VanZ family protein [Bacteroidota bacterium]|nr:VanZ family protein [Bacteroidota bacterium]
MKFATIVYFALIGIVIYIIFYLSWKPQPQISSVWFIPQWLGAWADAKNNDTIRTAVPFLFLGIASGACLLYSRLSAIYWIIFAICCIFIAFIAETGQLFLPHRSFDFKDILWGAAGSTAGLAITFIVGALIKRIVD